MMTIRFLTGAGLLALALPAAAQFVPAPLSDADRLAAEMRLVGASPRDVAALTEAGELSVKVGDLSGAASLLARADKVDPRNGRVKAGIATVLLRTERPGEALQYFGQAEGYGYPVVNFAADRALAYDLTGQQGRAQRDYRLALAAAHDPETVRRYALSLAISGQKDAALLQLDPLVRAGDRGAWRARAFVLAMSGDAAGATAIATRMMAPGQAQGLAPFFGRLPTLGPVDRAFAVQFGEVRATPERLADARLAPALPPMAPEIVALPTPVRPAPVQVAAVTTKPVRRGHGRQPVEVAAVTPAPVPSAPALVAPAYAPPPVTLASATPAYAPQVSYAPAASHTTARRGRSRDTSAADANRQALTAPAGAPVTLAAARPVVPAVTASTPVPMARPTAPATTVASAPVALAAARPTVATPAPVLAARAVLPTAVPTPTPVVVAQSSVPTPTATPAPVLAQAAPIAPAGTSDAVLSRLLSQVALPSDELARAGAIAAHPELAQAAPPAPAPVVEALPAPVAVQPAPPPRAVVVEPVRQHPAFAPPIETATAEPRAVHSRPVAQPQSEPAEDAPSAPKPTRAHAAKAGTELAAADTGFSRHGKPAATEPASADDASSKHGAKAKVAESDDDAPLTPAQKRAAARKAAAEQKAAEEKKAAIAEAREEAKAEAEAKRVARAEPQRYWVQVAGGANTHDLPRAWSEAQKKASALKGKSGWTTPLRATNRVLAGPFKSNEEAKTFMDKVRAQGIQAWQFTSQPGQKVSKLDDE